MNKGVKIVLGILGVLALFVVGVLSVAAMQPDDYRIERSTTMAAPPSVIFEQIDDFHKWGEWSPWAKLDEKATNTFSGPTSGEGAMFAWAGNSEVGEGKMTILESRPNELVRIKLEFFKPFAGQAEADFTMKPQGDKTVVTWGMSGKSKLLEKAICLFMDRDKMMGEKFDEGLASMKAVAERGADGESADSDEKSPPPAQKEPGDGL